MDHGADAIHCDCHDVSHLTADDVAALDHPLGHDHVADWSTDAAVRCFLDLASRADRGLSRHRS